MRLERYAAAIILVMFIFHIAVNSYVLTNSKILRVADDLARLESGYRFYIALNNKDFRSLKYQFTKLSEQAHPHVFELIEGLIYFVINKINLGSINLLILLTNAIFLLVLLITTYKIGSILYDKKIGLLAVFLLSFSPVIFSHARIMMLDFPLTAMCALFFLTLLKTNNFKSLPYILLTGICFSLSQLTKETAIIFIFPTLLYYIFISLSIKDQRGRKIANIIIFLLIIVSLAGVIYFNPNNKDIFRTYWGKTFLMQNADYFNYYITSCPLLYFGIIPLIVLAPAILKFMFKLYNKKNVFINLWIFVPLLLFLLSSNKASRFIMPLLPPLCLGLSSAISDLFSNNRFKSAYMGILISVIIFQYAALNFFPNIRAVIYPYDVIRHYRSVFDIGILSIRIDKEYNVAESIINIFNKEKNISQKNNKVISTFRTGLEDVLKLEFLIKNMPYYIDCPQCRDTVDALKFRDINWQQYLLTADYVIDKTGDLGARGSLQDIGGEFKKSLIENGYLFKEIANFKDTEGNSYFIYKK